MNLNREIPGCDPESVAEAAEWVDLQSSNLARARYAVTEKALDIQFKDGNIYRYQNVPDSVFGNLLSAAFCGRYFHSRIKGFYRYGKLEE